MFTDCVANLPIKGAEPCEALGFMPGLPFHASHGSSSPLLAEFDPGQIWHVWCLAQLSLLSYVKLNLKISLGSQLIFEDDYIVDGLHSHFRAKVFQTFG